MHIVYSLYSCAADYNMTGFCAFSCRFWCSTTADYAGMWGECIIKEGKVYLLTERNGKTENNNGSSS